MQDSDHLRASRLSTLRSKLATRDEPSLISNFPFGLRILRQQRSCVVL